MRLALMLPLNLNSDGPRVSYAQSAKIASVLCDALARILLEHDSDSPRFRHIVKPCLTSVDVDLIPLGDIDTDLEHPVTCHGF